MKKFSLLALGVLSSITLLASCGTDTSVSSTSSSSSETSSSVSSSSSSTSSSSSSSSTSTSSSSTSSEVSSSTSSSTDTSTSEPTTDYSIAQITTAGDQYTIRGVVDGKNTRSLVVTDGTNSVAVYDSDLVSEFAIGDYVEVSGTVASYNEALQFTYSDVEVSLVDDGSAAPTPADPVALTPTVADSWATISSFTTSDVKEYSWTATAGKSGSYTTLNLDGSDTVIEPVYLDSSAYTLTEGTAYDVTGYVTGYSTSYSYASIILTSATPSSSVSDAVTGVTVTPDSATVAVGATTQLSATVLGSGTFDNTVTWSSSDEAVATVDTTGLVTGVAEGEATVTATSVGDSSFFASATITVSNEEVITAISDITSAGDYTIKGVVAAANSKEYVVSDGTAGIVVYTALDSSLAIGDYVEVSGSVTIYSKMLEFGNTATVTKIEDETDKPTLPDPTALTADIANGWGTLTTGAAFPTTAVQEYSWSAVAGESNGYVTLNIDGSSVAIEPGKTTDAYIDGISFEEGATYSVSAYVTKATSSYANVLLTSATKTAEAAATVTDVTVSPSSATVAVGGTTTLTATVDGTGDFDDTVTWSSSDETVATVDGGVVTGVAEGTATITATSVSDSTVSGSAVITVVNADSDTLEQTYTHTWKNGEISKTAGSTSNINGIIWDYTDATYIGFDSSNGRGIQIGSSGSPQTTAWTLSSSFEDDLAIKSFSITVGGAGSGSGEFEITIGDVIESETYEGSVQEYSYTDLDSTTDSLSFSFIATAKAFYLKSISFTADVPVDSGISLTSDAE